MMKFEKIHNYGQAQLFKNKYLEYLTKTHPLVIWSIYLPIIIFLVYFNFTKFNQSIVTIFLTFLVGMLFWTFFEYCIHRFAFHFIAEKDKAKNFVYLIHGNHHQYPRDKERLFMPPVPSLIVASSIFFTMYYMGYLLNLTSFVFTYFSGFMLGYLIYGSMHYAIHAWTPPFKWMKPLWRNHHLHHYKDENKGFGVSSTLWDRVFGTMFNLSKEKEDKQKVQELMFNRSTHKSQMA